MDQFAMKILVHGPVFHEKIGPQDQFFKDQFSSDKPTVLGISVISSI